MSNKYKEAQEAFEHAINKTDPSIASKMDFRKSIFSGDYKDKETQSAFAGFVVGVVYGKGAVE